jgi:hypothetical protein
MKAEIRYILDMLKKMYFKTSYVLQVILKYYCHKMKRIVVI